MIWSAEIFTLKSSCDKWKVGKQPTPNSTLATVFEVFMLLCVFDICSKVEKCW